MTQPPISGSPAASLPTRDDLERPVTQRQLLHALDLLRKTLRDGRVSVQELWRDPKLRLERALELTWETLTTEWRQEARCPRCRGSNYVCEDHADKPWAGPNACNCGAAGVLCTHQALTEVDDHTEQGTA